MAKKTTLSFTAEELEIVKAALNGYSLELIQQSTTWGVRGTLGNEDYYHLEAYKTQDLWCRFYTASKKLRETETTTAE